MKLYEIFDEELNLSIGTLIYFDKSRSAVIELQDYLDEWTAPLLFTSFVKKKEFTICGEFSLLWIKERIIPSSRQNIDDILRTHKLKEYDEMTFLDLSGGRCSQDSMLIRKLKSVPDYVTKRAQANIIECAKIAPNTLLCVFADGTIRRINISQLPASEDINKVMRNPLVFDTVCLGPGGYSILFNGNIELSARLLYTSGVLLPLSFEELTSFINHNILDTSESCRFMDCSRQNIAYLVKEDCIYPIKENVKGNLYLKGNLQKNKW